MSKNYKSYTLKLALNKICLFFYLGKYMFIITKLSNVLKKAEFLYD